MNHPDYVKNAAAPALLLVMVALMFTAFGILGAAIGWPGSLADPAEVNLPAILAHLTAVRIGYAVYLLYSILFFPMAYAVMARLRGREGFSRLDGLALGFAALSTLARVFGIVRWLTAMPLLSERWSTAPGRAIELIFESLNSWAGGVGEIVGVGIFAGIWAWIASWIGLRSGSLPKWIAVLGLVSAIVVMSPVVELFGFEIGGLITVSTSLIHIWWLALAGYFVSAKAR